MPSGLTKLTELIGSGSDLRWNGLYTFDPAVAAFLDDKASGWRGTRTIPVTGLAAGPVTSTSVTLTWLPIAYTSNAGGYQVFFALTPRGPYTLVTTTADKTAGSATAAGLPRGVTCYLVVRSVTHAHADNQSTVVSGQSAEVSVLTLGRRLRLHRSLKRVD